MYMSNNEVSSQASGERIRDQQRVVAKNLLCDLRLILRFAVFGLANKEIPTQIF